MLHDLPKQGLDAFGHPYRPGDSVFRCLAGDDDTREGSLIEMDPGSSHRPDLGDLEAVSQLHLGVALLQRAWICAWVINPHDAETPTR